MLLSLDPVTPAVLLAIELALRAGHRGAAADAGPAYLAAAARRRRRRRGQPDRGRRWRTCCSTSGRSRSPVGAVDAGGRGGAAAARDRAARHPGAGRDRPDGPRRRARAALARAGPVRLRRAGRAAAAAAAVGRLAPDRPGPAGPRPRRRAVAGGAPAGVRREGARGAGGRRASRGPARAPRWRPAASAPPACRAPSPGRSRCCRGDWWLLAGAVAAVLVATAVSVAVGSWRLPFA